jgi:hypothetical protein
MNIKLIKKISREVFKNKMPAPKVKESKKLYSRKGKKKWQKELDK